MMDGFKSYLITDPSFYSSQTTFKNYLTSIYKKYKIDFACYRDKTTYSKEYAKLFLDISKEFGIKKVLLNTHYQDAKELGYDGVHLTSKQFYDIKKAKELDLFVIISCHDKKEVLKAKELGADMGTYSPIFSTPNKGEPKGVKKLKEVSKILDIFALGGIVTKEQIQQVKQTGCVGFASIRYFTLQEV